MRPSESYLNHRYVYIEASLVTVSMGHYMQAVCHIGTVKASPVKLTCQRLSSFIGNLNFNVTQYFDMLENSLVFTVSDVSI